MSGGKDRAFLKVACPLFPPRTVQELLGDTDVRTTMISTHVLNRGGKGVRSPADALGQGVSPSQLERNYAGRHNTPTQPCGAPRQVIEESEESCGRLQALAAYYTGQHTQ
jgi:hypothetical protein